MITQEEWDRLKVIEKKQMKVRIRDINEELNSIGNTPDLRPHTDKLETEREALTQYINGGKSHGQ